MFIGSDNQFRNLYVMKAYKASESAITAVGDATLKVDTAKNLMYLVYKDTEDTLTSDIINIKNLLFHNYHPPCISLFKKKKAP